MSAHHPSEKEELVKAVEELDEDIIQLDHNIDKLSHRLSFWPVVFRGILSALAYAIGATIVLGLIIILLEKLTGVPLLGDFFQLIADKLALLQQ